MTDLFGYKIVHASQNEPANKIIERAGVETFVKNGVPFWTYKGKTIPRPMIHNWENLFDEEFKIKIVYDQAH